MIVEEQSLTGVPVQTYQVGDDSQLVDMGEQHVIEFETALMALEPMKKVPQPCPKKTMTFGVALTKKNFEYLRPNQIKEIKAKQ